MDDNAPLVSIADELAQAAIRGEYLPGLFTIPEAADKAHTTTRTVRRWIADGRLPKWDFDGRPHVHEADLNRVEAETRRRGGKPRKPPLADSLS